MTARAHDQLPPEELLPRRVPELLPVSGLTVLLVPGFRIAPELELAPLLLLLLPLRAVPAQSGASPLAAATASPRNPITVASQR